MVAQSLRGFQCWLLVIFVAGSAGPAWADAFAPAWPCPRGPSREPAPYQFQAEEVQRLPREFVEETPACILYCGLTHLVEPDGTVETITHEITRLNGRKGIEKLGEYRNITYDPAYEAVTLNEARVHKADGSIVKIEPKHVQLRDLGTDYLVYDHDKQLIISFPSLEVGDVIEVKWTTRGKNPEHAGHFFTRYTFGDEHYPVVLDEMRVRVPKSKTLKYAADGGVLELDVRADLEHRTYHWRATNRRELPQDENLPPKDELRLSAACSTFSSWEEVGRWKRRIQEECGTCTPEIRKVVEETIKDLRTPLEKARALTYWVRRHVRYMSAGEKHDYTPHLPAQVLSNRFGDCKDQGQLLAVMLRAAGLPAALVTLGTEGDGQVLEAVPSPWGSHAIVLTTIDGTDHWIDTTVSFAAWDRLPRDDCDRACYVVDDRGIRLMRTPPAKPEDNRIEQTSRVSIGADGSSRCERDCVFHGLAALSQRNEWLEVPPGERRRLVSNELQNNQSRARLCRLDIDEKQLRDFDQPVAARLVHEVPGHFSGDDHREGSLTDNQIWSKLLSYNLDYDRQAALHLGAPFEVVHCFHIHLPPAYRFEGLPKEQKADSPWGKFALTVHADPKDPRKLDLKFYLRLEKSQVEPAGFEAFHAFHEEVLKHYRVWLTVKPTVELEDAPALEVLLALAPTDVAAATILVRLYQVYQGKMRAEARRVLKRARAYHPNDPALCDLALDLAENPKEEEAAYRELMRRRPDEPRYALALGESRINRGDYKGAKKVLEPIVKQGPDKWRAQACYQLARGSLLQGHADVAYDQLVTAAGADANLAASATFRLFMGQIHEKKNQPDDARTCYQSVLQIDPQREEALASLIGIEMEAGNRAEALDYLRRYSVAAEAAAGLAKAADFYLRLERFDEAQDLAERARKKDAGAGVDRVLGLVALQREDFKEAAAHLERAKPDDEVLEGLIRSQVALGDLSAAQRQAQRIKEIETPSPALAQSRDLIIGLAKRRAEVHQAMRPHKGRAEDCARALDRLVCAEHGHAEGRPADEVATLLAEVFAIGLDIGPAFALRGQLALEKGRLTKALADAERAVALSPREALGYYVRGRVRLERNAKGALGDLSRAAELNQRNHPDMLHALALALYRAGARAEALAALRDALQLRPDDPEITEQLREWEKKPR